jgi:hypothetical protein
VNKSTLAQTALGTNESDPYRIAVDATTVFWATNQGHEIRAVPIGGGSPRTLYVTLNAPTAIAVDDTYLYWVDGSVNKAPKNVDAGAPTVLGGHVDASELRIDSTSLYFWGQQNLGDPVVFALDKVTGAERGYAYNTGNDTAFGIAVNSQSAFWFWDHGYPGNLVCGLYVAPKGAPSSSYGIVAVDVPGHDLVADDCNVYWTTDNSTIWSAGVAGGGAQQMTASASKSHRLAVDDAYVYWTDQTWIGRIPN